MLTRRATTFLSGARREDNTTCPTGFRGPPSSPNSSGNSRQAHRAISVLALKQRDRQVAAEPGIWVNGMPWTWCAAQAAASSGCASCSQRRVLSAPSTSRSASLASSAASSAPSGPSAGSGIPSQTEVAFAAPGSRRHRRCRR